MATQIKLLKGIGVTNTNPAIKDGQLLFDTQNKSIWLDISDTTRIKLYNSLDTALVDIANLKTLVGTDSVADQIADAIGVLKQTLITSVEDGETTTVVLTDLPDGAGKKLKVEVKLSPKADNVLRNETSEGNEGLYVPEVAAPEYTIEKAGAPETGFAATYKLMKDGTQVGTSINIIKDKFLKTVTIEDEDGEGNTGKFIKMVFETDDADNTIYLNVNELVDVYTSGSATGDMVVITIDETTNKITAEITDGTVTKEKLHVDIQTSLGKADTALQPANVETAENEEGKYIAGAKYDETEKKIVFEKKALPSLTALEWGTWTTIGE